MLPLMESTTVWTYGSRPTDLITTDSSLELNTTQNSSEPALDPVRGPPGLFQLILQILLCCCIFGGNMLILAVVFVAKDMKQVTCYFISNLALSDLCFGLALILRCVLAVVKPSSMYPCRIVLSLAITSGITSLIGIMLLCWQTYLAVKKMAPFHLAVSVTTARVCITVSWLVSCLIGLLNIRFTKDIPATDVSTKACFFGSGYTHTGYLIVLTSIIFTTFIFISYSQIMTMITLHKRQRIILPTVTVNSSSSATPAVSSPPGLGAPGPGTVCSPLGIKGLQGPGFELNRANERERELKRGDSGREGVLGRQGSVNEIRLQIPLNNTGAEHLAALQRDAVISSKQQVSPMIFLAKDTENVRCATGTENVTSGMKNKVRSQITTKSKVGCFTCVPHKRTPEGQQTAENSSGGSLKAIREYHRTKKITGNHMRVMAVISYILVVFTIGWCPYMVALFLYAMCETHCGINANILSGLLNLCVLQSFSNFFVYFIKDATFKSRVKQICSFGRDLGFMNRVGPTRSGDQGMFGAVVTRRTPSGAAALTKRVKSKTRKSDSKRVQLQCIS